ncbi:hypothetical protein ABZU75_46145 [Streptosporangium sp. NPDC005286]
MNLRPLDPQSNAAMPGAFWRGLRLMALGGTTMEAADSAANRQFL